MDGGHIHVMDWLVEIGAYSFEDKNKYGNNALILVRCNAPCMFPKADGSFTKSRRRSKDMYMFWNGFRTKGWTSIG